MSPPVLLLSVALSLCLAFAVLYGVARRLDNYGIVDIAWSYAFALVAAFFALTADTPPLRRALLATIVGLWSLRLGTHLLRRIARHHPTEDSRYRALRAEWDANFAPRMFGFFQLQAASVMVLAAPFFLIARNPSTHLHPLELAGLALWFIALVGETLADRQLAAFARQPGNRGRVCAVGLWRYSRHPNYFFEWLVWVAYALLALPAPLGAIGLLSPAVILWLLLRVTGIPLAERQSLASKGEAYRAYQYTTSAFIPWPPRR